MAQNPTSDQIVEAAKDLGQTDFTRADIASKLGVEKADLQGGFRGARKAGQLKKVREDAEGMGVFELGS